MIPSGGRLLGSNFWKQKDKELRDVMFHTVCFVIVIKRLCVFGVNKGSDCCERRGKTTTTGAGGSHVAVRRRDERDKYYRFNVEIDRNVNKYKRLCDPCAFIVSLDHWVHFKLS
jgi:hypothetical protein